MDGLKLTYSVGLCKNGNKEGLLPKIKVSVSSGVSRNEEIAKDIVGLKEDVNHVAN